MMDQRHKISQMTGVSVIEMKRAYMEDIKKIVTDANIIESLEAEPCYFWNVNGSYYFDDAGFGEPINVLDLAYSPIYGMCNKSLISK